MSDKGKRSMYDAGFLDMLEEDEVRVLIPEDILDIFLPLLICAIATPFLLFTIYAFLFWKLFLMHAKLYIVKLLKTGQL